MRSTEWKRITWFAEQRLQYVRNTRAVPVFKLNYDSYRVCFTSMNITGCTCKQGLQFPAESVTDSALWNQVCHQDRRVCADQRRRLQFWVAVRVTDTWTTWTFAKGWSGPRATSWETERSSEIKQLHVSTGGFWKVYQQSSECVNTACVYPEFTSYVMTPKSQHQ